MVIVKTIIVKIWKVNIRLCNLLTILTINIILNIYNTIYYYLQICCHNNTITKKFILLTRDFS